VYDRKERVLSAIARIEAKRDAQRDPLCRRYYELCLIGWERWLKKLEAGKEQRPRMRDAGALRVLVPSSGYVIGGAA